jgi:predicted RNA-binding protein with PIN domain
MKTYLIDGKNVYSGIASIWDSSDERRAFIDYLSSAAFFGPKKNATVVFDGAADENRPVPSVPHIKILYSDYSEADDVIRNIIRREGKKHRDRFIVVTNDNEILRAAKEFGISTMKNADFLKQLRFKDVATEGPSPEQRDKITEELKKIWVK